MDKNEYWLLDSVVTSMDSLRCLVSEDVEGAFHKPSHGLDRDELISVLNRLFRRGDLLAKRKGKFVFKGFFVPTQREIEEAFDGRQLCFYGLTAQGGARWEEVSRPRWDLYIDSGIYADPEEGGYTSGSDRQTVELYDSLAPDVCGVSIVPGSKRWDVLEPWQATYWKLLPRGYRVRFFYEPTKVWRDPHDLDAAMKRLNEIHNWYTPYVGS